MMMIFILTGSLIVVCRLTPSRSKTARRLLEPTTAAALRPQSAHSFMLAPRVVLTVLIASI